MYIYFNETGEIKEVINDEAIRIGSVDVNKVYCYFEGEPTYTGLTRIIRLPDGTKTLEEDFISNTETKEIPYDKYRDMKYFKDYVEYDFYYFELGAEELTNSGLAYATVRGIDDTGITANGVITFNIEDGVILETSDISLSQFDYLLIAYASRTLNETTGEYLDDLISNQITNLTDAEFADLQEQIDQYIETETETINTRLNSQDTIIANQTTDLDTALTNVNSTLATVNGVTPSGTSTEAIILSLVADDGIWVATDTGYWYYWDENNLTYTQGGVYVSPVEAVITNEAEIAAIEAINTAQQTQIEDLIEATSSSGVTVYNQANRTTDFTLTDTSGEVAYVLETLEHASSDTTILDSDTSNNPILVSENEAGFRITGTGTVQNDSAVATTTLIGRLYVDGVETQSFTTTLTKGITLPLDKSFIVSVPEGQTPQTITVTFECTANGFTITEGSLIVTSLFSTVVAVASTEDKVLITTPETSSLSGEATTQQEVNQENAVQIKDNKESIETLNKESLDYSFRIPTNENKVESLNDIAYSGSGEAVYTTDSFTLEDGAVSKTVPNSFLIKGHSVKPNQVIPNGNFETFTGWYNNATDSDFSNNILTLTVTALTAGAGILTYEVTPVIGQKYFYTCKIKPKYNNDVQIGFNGLTKYVSLEAGVWQTIGAISDIVTTESYFKIYHSTATQYSLGDTWQIADVMVIPMIETDFENYSKDQLVSLVDLNGYFYGEQYLKASLKIDEASNHFDVVYDNTETSLVYEEGIFTSLAGTNGYTTILTENIFKSGVTYTVSLHNIENIDEIGSFVIAIADNGLNDRFDDIYELGFKTFTPTSDSKITLYVNTATRVSDSTFSIMVNKGTVACDYIKFDSEYEPKEIIVPVLKTYEGITDTYNVVTGVKTQNIEEDELGALSVLDTPIYTTSKVIPPIIKNGYYFYLSGILGGTYSFNIPSNLIKEIETLSLENEVGVDSNLKELTNLSLLYYKPETANINIDYLGAESYVSTRASTTNFITNVFEISVLNFDPNYYYLLVTYDENGDFVGSGGWKNDTQRVFETNYTRNYKLLYKTLDNSVLDVTDLKEKVLIKSETKSDYIYKAIGKKGVAYNNSWPVCEREFEETTYKNATRINLGQDACLIGDNFVGFNGSSDDHTLYAQINVIDKDTLADVKTLHHNLGHCASVDYNLKSDSVITANGTLDVTDYPEVSIIMNASAKIANSEDFVYGSDSVISIPFYDTNKQIGGSLATACWGANKNSFYLVSDMDSYSQIAKIQLGMGANDFSDSTGTDLEKWGTFISGKTDDEYNGTALVLEIYTGAFFPTKQGMTYHKGHIFVMTSSSTVNAFEIQVYKNGTYRMVDSYAFNQQLPTGVEGGFEAECIIIYDGYIYTEAFDKAGLFDSGIIKISMN